MPRSLTLLYRAQMPATCGQELGAGVGDQHVFFQVNRTLLRAYFRFQRENHSRSVELPFDFVERGRLGARHADAVTDPLRGLFLSAVFHIASDIQPEMKRFHFPHRFSLRREDNAGIQDLAKALVLSRHDVMNTRLAKGGPYLLGTRFSLADFYLSFWVAWIMALDRDGVRKRLPSIAKLYELVRSRPSARPYLDGTERWSEDYADMMKTNPAGVVA